MAEVKQVFSGDKTALETAYRDLAKEVVRLETQVQRLSTTSVTGTQQATRQHTALEGVLRRQIGAIAGVATSWLGVQTVVRAVNEQLERTIRLEEGASKAGKDLARGQADIILNTFGADDATRQRIAAGAQQIAVNRGLPGGLVSHAAGQLMGAGTGPLEERLKALDVAASLSRHSPEAMLPAALAIQQTQKITGMNEKEAASLALSGGSAAFIGEPALQFRFLQQVMSGVVSSSPGDKKKAAEQGMELGAFLTQVVGEERGEAARTAGISLSSQLDEYFGPGFDSSFMGHKIKIKAGGKDPGLPIDRLRYLQEHPAEAKRFLEHSSFERMFESPVRNLLLNPGGDEDKLLRETEKTVAINVPALESTIRALESGTPQMKAAAEAGMSESRSEAYKGQMTEKALQAEARQIRDETMQNTSKYSRLPAFLDNLGRWFGDRFGGDIEDQALGEIKKRAGEIRGTVGVDQWGRPTRDSMVDGTSVTRVMPTPDSMLLPGQRQALEYMNQQTSRLEEIDKTLKNIRGDLSRQQPSSVGPAMNGQVGSQSER
jgi:hypothetical protein